MEPEKTEKSSQEPISVRRNEENQTRPAKSRPSNREQGSLVEDTSSRPASVNRRLRRREKETERGGFSGKAAPTVTMVRSPPGLGPAGGEERREGRERREEKEVIVGRSGVKSGSADWRREGAPGPKLAAHSGGGRERGGDGAVGSPPAPLRAVPATATAASLRTEGGEDRRVLSGRAGGRGREGRGAGGGESRRRNPDRRGPRDGGDNRRREHRLEERALEEEVKDGEREGQKSERPKEGYKSEGAQWRRQEEGEGLAEGEENGVIASLQDSYGFIRCAQRDARIFFHFSGLKGCREDELRERGGVAFIVKPDPRRDRLIAANVRILPPGREVKFVQDDDGQRAHGVVARNPSPYHEGLISYTAPDADDEQSPPKTLTIPFNRTALVSPDHTPSLGCEVKFGILRDRHTGSKRAAHVVVTAPPQTHKYTGVVIMLKSNFGFVKCCERTEDIFFHVSSVQDEWVGETETIKIASGAVEEDSTVGESDEEPKELRPGDASKRTPVPRTQRAIRIGDEVEAWVSGERGASGGPGGGREHAVRVLRLPPGSVKFETVHPERLNGTCVRRVHDSKSQLPPHGGEQQGSGVEMGRIEYRSPADCGRDSVGEGTSGECEPVSVLGVSYTRAALEDPRLNPRAGEEVTFSLTTCLRTGTTRATQVCLRRYHGMVAYLKGPFGFIESEGLIAVLREERLREPSSPAAQEKAEEKEGELEGGESSKEPEGGGSKEAGKPRLFFHISEVEDKSVILREGDEVEFIVVKHPVRNEKMARKIVRTCAAPPKETQTPSKTAEEAPVFRSRFENSNMKEKTPSCERISLLPNSSPGFTFGRGKALKDIACLNLPIGLQASLKERLLRSLPTSRPASPGIKTPTGLGSNNVVKKLNMAAPAFVPKQCED